MKVKKHYSKIISLAMSAAMAASTLLTGGVANAAEASESLVKPGSYTGDATYIQTFMKSDYLGDGRTGFEIKFQYKSLATKEVEGKEVSDDSINYNDTFEFLVFDNSWGGWDKTMVGPNGVDKTGAVTPQVDTEYSYKVSFAEIEKKLSTENSAYGINLQTGGIGNASVEIVSLNYYSDGTQQESSDVLLEGEWKKTGDDETGNYGYMNLVSGTAYVSANAWNIAVGGFSVSDFEEPTVAVTVTYEGITETIYPQSEVLDAEYVPVVQNYPQVSKDGQVTYLTPIPKSMTSMFLAYDTCTVTKVEIYDAAESNPTVVNDLTNSDIIASMGAGWNLGNALDSVDNETGETGETKWGNPEVNKRLFKVVADAGFKTVRIPVTWVDAVDKTGDTYTVKESRFNEIKKRVKEVVNMARDYDLFVIINLQHDSGEGTANRWLDIDADAATMAKIKNVYGDIWSRLATAFKDYDQHLIFESMNEVMEKGNYSAPSTDTWNNINELNQLFVNKVRGVAGNEKRFLMVPGYNTNIDQTVTNNFTMPSYGTATGNDRYQYEMVSVHFYDPYDFTLNENGTGELDGTEADWIETQFSKVADKFKAIGVPVVVGEFGAMDKGNVDAIVEYISYVVKVAKYYHMGYIYWDNGYDGSNGMALWNRYTYAPTPLGKKLVPVLTGKSI